MPRGFSIERALEISSTTFLVSYQYMNVPLQSLLNQAQSGDKEDLIPLLNQLSSTSFAVPVLREDDESNDPACSKMPDSMQEMLGDEETPSSEFRPLLLENEQGNPFLIVLSDQSILPNIQDLSVVPSDLQAVELNAEDVYELARDLFEREDVTGVIFDLFQETELRMRSDEFLSMAEGQPVHLKYHLRGKNIGEEQIERVDAQGKEDIPDSFLEILSSYIQSDSAIEGFECIWGINPEVDDRAHLMLNVHTVKEIDKQERVKEINNAVMNHIPPPGFLEIMFDRTINNPIIRKVQTDTSK